MFVWCMLVIGLNDENENLACIGYLVITLPNITKWYLFQVFVFPSGIYFKCIFQVVSISKYLPSGIFLSIFQVVSN